MYPDRLAPPLKKATQELTAAISSARSRILAILITLAAALFAVTPLSAQPLMDGSEALRTTSETTKASGNGKQSEDGGQNNQTETNGSEASPDSATTPQSAPKPAEAVNTTATAMPVAAAKQQLEAWVIDLNHATATLQREGLSIDNLDDLSTNLETLRIEALKLQEEITPSVEALKARVTQLQPANEGDVESEDVKRTRGALQAELAELNGVVKQIKVVTLRTEELAGAINNRKRAIFAERLFERNHSILHPDIWLTAIGDLPEVAHSFALLASDWWGLINSKIGAVTVFVLIAIAATIFVIIVFSHRTLLHKTKRDVEASDPPLFRKVSAALLILVVNFVLPLLGVGAFFAIIEALGASPDRIDNVGWTVIYTVLALSAAHGLTRALLAPDRPTWRMVPLTDTAAERLSRLVLTIAAVLSLNIFLDGMARNLLAPLSILHLVHGALAVVFHILILISVRVIMFGKTDPADGDQAAPYGRSLFWRWIVPAAMIASIAGLVATLVGYISFGWFMATQIVWVATVLGLLHLLLIFVDEMLTTGMRHANLFGGPQPAAGQQTVTRSEQLGVILSGIVRLMLIAFAAILILTPWGVRSSKLFNSLEAAFFGIQIGDMRFSLSAVLIALAIFVAGIIATRSIQRWTETSLLPSTKLDIGLKTSIRTAIGYVGVIIAGMIAFSYAGLDLQNVAIVAGALSVGIGFGLQSIVNNFVSGLILLAERPIKVGDWIVVGDEQGYVRRINVRATEIETFDRASVIVPNSDLISGVVKNWMHNNATGRIIVGVGVAYGCDVDKVRDILLDAAREHSMVLAYPAPGAFFMGFGDSSLDFELRCYLSDINYALSTSSDLRYTIYRQLGEAGIEIPFPQRDINLRDIDRLEAAMKTKTPARTRTVRKTETDK